MADVVTSSVHPLPTAQTRRCQPFVREVGWGGNTFALLDEAVARVPRLDERALRPQRLTLPEYALMAKVAAFGEVRQGLLAERLRLSRQRVHQMVRQLEHNGSVQTHSDPRQIDVRVTLTPAGRVQLDGAHRGLRRIRESVFSRFGVQQEATMRILLEDLIEAVVAVSTPDRRRACSQGQRSSRSQDHSPSRQHRLRSPVHRSPLL